MLLRGITIASFSAALSLAFVSCCGMEAKRVTFPPEAVDHLSMAVSVDVEIFAIGKDTVEMKGTAAVHRSGPLGADGSTMVGDMIGGSFRGTSKVFGEVIAFPSPIQHTPCEYTYEEPGRYQGRFDINGWFWLPEHDLVVFSAAPVRVEGPADAIPPVGQKAESAAQDIALHDLRKPTENPIGVLSRARGEIHEVVSIESYLKTPDSTVPELSRKKN